MIRSRSPGASSISTKEQTARGGFGSEHGADAIDDVGALVESRCRIASSGIALSAAADPRPADAVGHRGDEVLRPDRLGEEVVAAGVERREMLFFVLFAREEDDRYADEAFPLADDRRELHTVHVGHVKVHQDQIGLELVEYREHPQGIGLGARLEPGVAQDRLREESLGAIVFDHQHTVGVGGLRSQMLAHVTHQRCGAEGRGRGRRRRPRARRRGAG